ncbi:MULTISPECIES: tetratricopeptide repeat protein [unclassified Roseovarius]|uniref:tetratricopeptide repeat protein n=1 Tax=unclassified Roseovarius TaxID=2614913 RepID=UPI00273FE842|nr:tetratricopeptide repeat protein [Roseovarius sp. MMSF_3350]
MKFDIFDQPISLSRDNAVDAWNKTMLGFLAHAAVTPKLLGEVLEIEPDFALGHAVKGMFYVLLGRRELMQTAREAHINARSALKNSGATPRERSYVDALGVWLDGSPSGAVAHFEEILDGHPQDALAMKLDHALRFVLGDASGMRRSVEKILPAYGHDHAARGYLLGCHAFALEETGEFEKAEIAGRQALWLSPDDAWGLHAVAHVHDMTANAAKGLEWLTGREDAWAHCNNFRYHVWWHKALMHLDLGQADAVLNLYDTQIRSEQTDDYRDISNATSLLMRLELEGVNVGNRWEELSEICANRTEDGCLIFADLHYLMALTGDKRPGATTRLLQRIAQDAKSNCEMGSRMSDPGVAAAQGLEAFGEARYDTAFANLAQARAGMQRAGGSHAQRDVFERITIDAGIRAGYLDQAEAILDDRQSKRAGREDGYTAARRALIASGRGGYDATSLPAE